METNPTGDYRSRGRLGYAEKDTAVAAVAGTGALGLESSPAEDAGAPEAAG
jgi:hypothetical protein